MENRLCTVCNSAFTLQDADLAFYQKIEVPLPTQCPFHRKLRRLMFRNDRKLYRRNCDLCNQSMISVYQADAPFPVYCPSCWWSDKWNASLFGRRYDPAKSFFEQWHELNKSVPHIALWQIQNENSEFSHDTSYNKNCYMLFGADYNRDCFYGWSMIKNNDCGDCSMVVECAQCYECTDCLTCQFCKYSQLLRNCSNCDLSFDLHNCHFCYGCTGLRNKSYCWFNEEIGKEEFLRRYNALQWTFPEILEGLQKSYSLSLATPRRAEIFRNCEECSGNFLGNCKNVRETFDAETCRDCAHGILLMETKDAVDCEILYYNIEIAYESQTLIRNCQQVKFSFFCRDLKSSSYCQECYMSADLFGCIGMRNAHNAILNKIYPKEEFEKLRAQIIEDMKNDGAYGEFFPMKYSPFAYNESAAIDYLMPLNKDEAEGLGLRWKEENVKEYQPQTYEVPENIKDVPQSICEELLACRACGKNFRILPQELKFYRELKVPIPQTCFDCRHSARIRRRGPRQLFERQCAKCSAAIRTTYGPDRGETVYCEKCYLETVY